MCYLTSLFQKQEYIECRISR